MNTQLYQEELLDHYRYPRNRGVLVNPDYQAEVLNSSCGDSISFHLAMPESLLIKVAFQGKGCVISQAAASLLTEKIISKSRMELASLTADDMIALVGIPLGPTRLRCALLALECLHKALHLSKES